MITFQLKSWCMVDGERQFVWSMTLLNSQLTLKCDDGKVRKLNEDAFEFLD